MAQDSPEVTLLSRMRLAPRGHPDGLQRIRLSISDSIATTLPPAQGIWYWDRPSQSDAFSPVNLITSLHKTLDAYPQFAGRLEEIQPGPVTDLMQARHGRFQVAYGAPDDPGIEVLLARCDRSIQCVEPPQRELDHLLGGQEAPLALEHGVDCTGTLPLVVIKATRFADGGLALAARLVHAMGDLPSLMQFLHDWAAVHRALISQQPPPSLSPVFDPALVDSAAAAKGVEEVSPDAQLIQYARQAPIHRFDWWAPSSRKGVPPGLAHRARMPPPLQHLPPAEFDQPIPWHDWM